MPLTPQEERCVDLACSYLSSSHGGAWAIEGLPLDDVLQDRATPEVIVANGALRAAIEVKRITGDRTWDAHLQSWRSLGRRLVPSCGGSYLIVPFVDFRLPMHPSLIRIVRKEIERVAPGLRSTSDHGTIRIPRSAPVVAMNASHRECRIECHHGSGVIAALSDLVAIQGWYVLVDSDDWEHQILTDDAKAATATALKRACIVSASGEASTAHWEEEWEIIRMADDDERDFVEVLAVTDARSMLGVAIDALGTRLAAAQPKFKDVRWADLHVLVLDNVSGIILPSSNIAEATQAFGAADYRDLDLVLLVDKGRVTCVWPESRALT